PSGPVAVTDTAASGAGSSSLAYRTPTSRLISRGDGDSTAMISMMPSSPCAAAGAAHQAAITVTDSRAAVARRARGEGDTTTSGAIGPPCYGYRSARVGRGRVEG